VTRALVLALTAVSLAACAGPARRDEGVATLDALRDVQAACAAQGRTMKLKPEGDAQSIDAYACERN
jgi:hypothetical protein